MTALRWVICYDIPDDRRRRRVAEALDAVGDRIQGSVFEAVLTRRELKACLRTLSGLLDLAEDKFAAYQLCATCAGQRIYLGRDPPAVGEEAVFIV